LKPENIFVLQSSNQVRVKLVDFGLTKEADESTFTPFGGAGSTRYMAPELFRGGSGTIASDTFAFGVIAYELLCGEPPSGIAQPIIELRPSVSPYVSELITRCMSVKPESRPDLRDFRNLDLSDTVTLTLDKEPKSTQLGTNQHFGSTEKSTSTLTIVGQQGILVKVNGDSLFEPYEYTVSGPVGQVTNIDVSVEWSGVKLYRGLVALVVGQNETLLLESAVQLRGQLPDWARVRTAKGHVTLPTYGLASDLQYAEVLYNGSVQSRIDLEKRSGDVEVTVSHGLSTIDFTQSDFITIQDTGGTSLRFPHKMLVPLAGEFVTLKLSSRNQQSSTIKFYVLPGQQQLNPMNPAMLDKHDRMSLFNICCPHISKYLQSMERIEAALFDMGSTTSDNQQPVHKVSLTSFRIGSKPFNVAAWREYCLATGSSMPDAPEWGWIDDHPIVNVSWNDIMGNNGFCSWLKSVTGQNYELPTEAQWEYVARGGDKCRNFPWGDDFDSSLAWSSVDSPTHLTRTASVDRTTRIYINGFALEDLVGNVWEWCSNWYVGKYSVSMTKKSVTSTREVPMHGIRGLLGETVMEQFTEEISHPTLLTNPKGPSTGTTRTLRGGSWASNKANRLTVSYRYGQKPDLRENDNGFRLCINEK
jgi:formylglycine-generating enzyme required for sulfatase activity